MKWEIPGWCVLYFCLILSQHHTPGIRGTEPSTWFSTSPVTVCECIVIQSDRSSLGLILPFGEIDACYAFDYICAKVSTEEKNLGKWRHKKAVRKISNCKKQRHFRRMGFAFQQLPQVRSDFRCAALQNAAVSLISSMWSKSREGSLSDKSSKTLNINFVLSFLKQHSEQELKPPLNRRVESPAGLELSLRAGLQRDTKY